MTSNIGNYKDNTLFTAQHTMADRQPERISRLFGSKKAESEVFASVASERKDGQTSSLYTADGMHMGARRNREGTFAEKSSVQRVLEKISRDAYRDWEDTALYQKMSLMSKLFEKRTDESESEQSSLYEKERNEASKPYPARDMLMGEENEASMLFGREQYGAEHV